MMGVLCLKIKFYEKDIFFVVFDSVFFLWANVSKYAAGRVWAGKADDI